MTQIKIDPDRFDDLLGDEFFGFFEGNPIWLYKALSHFVMNGNNAYMEPDEALKWLKANFTLRQIKEIRSEFLKELQEKAVPLASEKQSETPPSVEPK
jgi:hypothetical protein